MSAAAWCDFSDLPVESCAGACCRPDLVEKPDRTVVTVFRAQYAGRGVCGHPIEVGDQIAWTADRDLLCEGCTT